MAVDMEVVEVVVEEGRQVDMMVEVEDYNKKHHKKEHMQLNMVAGMLTVLV